MLILYGENFYVVEKLFLLKRINGIKTHWDSYKTGANKENNLLFFLIIIIQLNIVF